LILGFRVAGFCPWRAARHSGHCIVLVRRRGRVMREPASRIHVFSDCSSRCTYQSYCFGHGDVSTFLSACGSGFSKLQAGPRLIDLKRRLQSVRIETDLSAGLVSELSQEVRWTACCSCQRRSSNGMRLLYAHFAPCCTRCIACSCYDNM